MPYRGINILLLWGESIVRGYAANIWMTFRQAQQLGAHVRKGEHGSMVVFADRVTMTQIATDGHEVEYKIPFLKAYTVFNVEQVDDLPAEYRTEPEPREESLALLAHAEPFFAATGAVIPRWQRRLPFLV